MAKNDKEENLFMVVFTVTRSDVLAWANKLGIPLDKVTDDVIEMLEDRIRQGVGSWRESFEGMVEEAIKCPLDMVCFPSCPWREVSECKLPTVLK